MHAFPSETSASLFLPEHLNVFKLLYRWIWTIFLPRAYELLLVFPRHSAGNLMSRKKRFLLDPFYDWTCGVERSICSKWDVHVRSNFWPHIFHLTWHSLNNNFACYVCPSVCAFSCMSLPIGLGYDAICDYCVYYYYSATPLGNYFPFQPEDNNNPRFVSISVWNKLCAMFKYFACMEYQHKNWKRTSTCRWEHAWSRTI